MRLDKWNVCNESGRSSSDSSARAVSRMIFLHKWQANILSIPLHDSSSGGTSFHHIFQTIVHNSGIEACVERLYAYCRRLWHFPSRHGHWWFWHPIYLQAMAHMAGKSINALFWCPLFVMWQSSCADELCCRLVVKSLIAMEFNESLLILVDRYKMNEN